MKKKIFLGFAVILFVLLGVIVVAASFKLKAKAVKEIPKPYLINFSGFQGEILPDSDIETNGFLIKRPFEEARKWGEAAILVYPADIVTNRYDYRMDSIKIKIFMASPDTCGQYFYAERYLPFSWAGNSSYAVKNIKVNGKIFTVVPTVNEVLDCYIFLAFIFGIVFWFLAFLCGKKLGII